MRVGYVDDTPAMNCCTQCSNLLIIPPTEPYKMDFKSLMTAQIGKSKGSADLNAGFVKRGTLEAKREAEYRTAQDTILREREQRASKKRKLEEIEEQKSKEREKKKQRIAEEAQLKQKAETRDREAARRKRLGLPELPENEDTADDDQDDDPDLPNIASSTLIPRLRKLMKTEELPEESHKAQLRRYYALIQQQDDRPIPNVLSPVPAAEMKVASSIPAVTDLEARKLLHRQLASYFNLVLSEWAISLSARSQDVKESFAGKAVINGYLSALDTMKPLFRQFEAADLPEDILKPVVDIVRAMQERRYVDANNGYLTLSIGKAAWPIGVTMVGIHERSAREKLHGGVKEAGKAHIMSDEKTRKWLQSIKRCLSFAQTRWPPEDLAQLMG